MEKPKKTEFKRVYEKYYIAAQVDDFLDILKTNYQELYEEAMELRLELKRAKEDKEQIDLKQLRTERCVSLLDAAGRAADTYVKEVEQKMEVLLREAKEKTEAQLDQARNQSTAIIREARDNADVIQQEAESKVAEVLAAGRRELTRIQTFLEESNQEYTMLLASRRDSELL